MNVLYAVAWGFVLVSLARFAIHTLYASRSPVLIVRQRDP